MPICVALLAEFVNF